MKEFFKSKLNIVIVATFSLFIVCAACSYLHQSFVYIAIIFAAIGLFAMGIKQHLEYKKLKRNLRSKINSEQKKSKKRLIKLQNLTPLKLQFVSLYLISISVFAYSVAQLLLYIV